MQIYHVETQEDYDALMVELSDRGAKWISGQEATDLEEWHNYKECTGIFLENNIIEYSDIDFFKEDFPDTPIQKYKAKQNGYIEGEYYCMPKKKTLSQAINDVVNSPNHYTQGEYEVIDILEDKLTSDEYMGFLKGNVTKYNFRELYKNQDEDIAKAEFYQKKMKEFVAKGKTIYSRIAKRFTKVTGYEFDNEFIKQLESGELKIVRTDDGSQVNDPTGDIY